MVILQQISDKLGDRNRLKKYNYFVSILKPNSNSKILDVGASEKEYRAYANILEKKYPYHENITALSVETYKEFCNRYPKVRTLAYDGNDFPFSDSTFDFCWCNAVIEHVGNREKQKHFLKELSRVARAVFFSTPNRFFPFELHTKLFLLHYCPKSIFDWILKKIGKAWAADDYMHLLSMREIKKLLIECNIKEYTVIKNRLFGFVVDYVIIFGDRGGAGLKSRN